MYILYILYRYLIKSKILDKLNVNNQKYIVSVVNDFAKHNLIKTHKYITIIIIIKCLLFLINVLLINYNILYYRIFHLIDHVTQFEQIIINNHNTMLQ